MYTLSELEVYYAVHPNNLVRLVIKELTYTFFVQLIVLSLRHKGYSHCIQKPMAKSIRGKIYWNITSRVA